MAITAISNSSLASMQVDQARQTPFQSQQNFAQSLKEAIAGVNEQQIASDQATNTLINGGDIELHDVMIASQKASVSLELTMQVRNKAVEAYQEMMRMSV
ncbi:MAG: flagellar hook-basal body complex protein FliE [Caryophanon sp.]|nr:flagellar hook-basal body complex protein FliE [Caryophanon sp.]